MKRFFVEDICPEEKFIILRDPDQLHHFKDVLRIKPLEEVVIFDGSGSEYITVVKEAAPREVKLEVKGRREADDQGVKITVACAIPKNVKMDEIVDKLTQLGVECIIPLQTERVIVKLDKQKKLERLNRWQKIALSASKQSQRSSIPKIAPIAEFKDALSACRGFDLKLIPTLEGKRRSLREIFSSLSGNINRVILFIGPEGDFTPGEVALAEEAGFSPVSLGRRVLRVDTAAIAVVSFLKLNEEY